MAELREEDASAFRKFCQDGRILTLQMNDVSLSHDTAIMVHVIGSSRDSVGSRVSQNKL